MKKTVLWIILLMAACLIGCGQPAADNDPADTSESAVEAESIEEAISSEENTKAEETDTSTEQAAESESADADAAETEDTDAVTDKTAELADGFITLYTRDGGHSVTFPSIGSILGLEGSSANGTPDPVTPWGSTFEMFNSTYGTAYYNYDCTGFVSPEEYLADRVPSKYTIENNYSEGYEEGPVETVEINGYTVSIQRFSFTENDFAMPFWHVAFMTNAGKLLTMDFSVVPSAEYQDEPFPEDWYRPIIEGLTEG